MVEGSNEDPKCASLKNVLSEMVASETTEPNKDIFDVEDSLEDTDIIKSKSIVVENKVGIGFNHLEVGVEYSSKSAALIQSICA